MSNPSPRRARAPSPLLAALAAPAAALLLSCGAVCAAADRAPRAAKPAKPAFYATSEACAAAGIFGKSQCDNAFSNAEAQIRGRRLAFASRIDCLLRFRLCERLAGRGAEGDYSPVVLGVEIVRGPGGGLATPVLATPTPRGLLPSLPIAIRSASLEDPREPESLVRRAPVLPTDHFAPVDPGGVREAWAHFRPRAESPPEFNVEEEPAKPRETPQQRRVRLQDAPYVD